MYCKHCGNLLVDGAKFCTKCGNAFNAENNKKFSTEQRGSSLKKIIIVVIVVIFVLFVKAVVVASLNEARQKGEAAKNTEDNWQTFNSVSDQFSIIMPNYPETKSTNDTTKSGIAYRYDTFSTQKGDEYFFVAKYIYSTPIDTSDTDSYLEKVVNAFINGASAKLITSTYSNYQSYRALDFLAENSDGNFKGRIILVDQTPYLLVMGFPANDYIDSDYQKFINSFQLN